MGNAIYFCFFLLQAGLFTYVVRMKTDQRTPRLLLLMVIACLMYDNGVSAAGFLTGPGQVLKALSIPRFILHVFVTPLVCVLCLQIARAARVPAALHRRATGFVWALTIVLMLIGFMQDLAPMDFVPKTVFGVLTYTHTTAVIPMAAIIMNVFTIATALLLWRTTGWPVLFITSVLMLLIAAIPHAWFGLIPGNAGEIIFIYGFIRAVKKTPWINCDKFVKS
jgi:hypothetical protein